MPASGSSGGAVGPGDPSWKPRFGRSSAAMDARQAILEVRRPTARYRSLAAGGRNGGAAGSAQAPIEVGGGGGGNAGDGAGPEIIDLEAESSSPLPEVGLRRLFQGEGSSSIRRGSLDEPLPKRARSSSSSSSRPVDDAPVAIVNGVAVGARGRLVGRGGDFLTRRQRWRQAIMRGGSAARPGGGGGGGAGGGAVGDATSEQVREDERLARQLQQEFASEGGNASGGDAVLARQLQDEERLRVHRPVDRSELQRLQALYVRRMESWRTHQASSRQAEAVRRSRMLGRFRMLSEPLSEIGAVVRRRAPLALELAYVDRDFNENDYETLLALDDGVKQHGASQTRIDSLPVSEAVETDKSEPCSICLDIPASGEQIRRLPCLHSFHQKCIDAWLQRRANCPVCKASV